MFNKRKFRKRFEKIGSQVEFNKRKLCKRFEKIGSQVDVAFLLYLNNQEPIQFPSESDAMMYIHNFREENVIFKLQIFRIETYSL